MSALEWEEFIAGYKEGCGRLFFPAKYYHHSSNWKNKYPPYITNAIAVVSRIAPLLADYHYDKAWAFSKADDAMTVAANHVANMWTSKTRAWACGFLWAIVKHVDLHSGAAYAGRYLDSWFTGKTGMRPIDLYILDVSTPEQEETPVSNHTQYPHIVVVKIDNTVNVRHFVYDLEFFKLAVGDHVVVCDANASQFITGKVVSIEGPMKFEQSVPPMVVSRIDTVQFETRRANHQNRRKALLMMQEAAKRNIEQDLFEQVKGKLTDDEREFIAATLGYDTGAQPKGEGDGQQRAQAAD